MQPINGQMLQVKTYATDARTRVVPGSLLSIEWANNSYDAKRTTAFPDYLTHHRHLVEAGNDCYRFRQRSRLAKASIKPREQPRERAGEEAVAEPF